MNPLYALLEVAVLVSFVLAAGADSVAVITDIVTSQDPEARVENWMAATAPWRNLSTGSPQG
mgnify:CR=1 FL=1